MTFKEGSFINKGQTLFIIDPRLYKAHVDKARAQLNKSKAQAKRQSATSTAFVHFSNKTPHLSSTSIMQ